MRIEILNRKQTEILRNLGKFKFLDYDQMIRLGVDRYKPNIAKLIKDLRDSRQPLVRKIPHSFSEKAIYYLTKLGAETLLETEQFEDNTLIHFPKSRITRNTQDAVHRSMLIDIQITLELASKDKCEIILCDRYFDKTILQKDLKAQTALLFEKDKKLIPDMNFILNTDSGLELFLLELERHNHKKKALEKMKQHAKALLLGSANKLYDYNKAYRILFIFEEKKLYDSTLNELQKDSYYSNLQEYFLFKTLDEISSNDFFEGWISLSGNHRKMYY